MASKFGVPVSFVFTLKEGTRRYHFYATPPELFPYPSKLKQRQEQLKAMVEKYVASLENILSKYPHQWFNYFPFWEEEVKALAKS